MFEAEFRYISYDAIDESMAQIADIELDIRDLPPAPAGSYYQAWLHGTAGAVSIGTFHLRDGSDGISLWAGVGADAYPVVMVTVQSEGSTTAPGRLVLVGRTGG